MRQLTTGELAQLFNISKYKIRHYIDEGILTPERNKQNGYYFFKEYDIYRLYQIIIFRKIGLSIKEIKESFSMNNNINMLEKAEIDLQHEINELLEIQKTIHKIVSSQKNCKLDEITFIDREKRYYKKVPKKIIEKDSIDYFKAVKLGISHLDELYYVFSKNSSSVLCLKSKKEYADYLFPPGIYACKNIIAKDKDSIENQIYSLLKDLSLNKKNYSFDNIIVYENIFCSLAYRDIMIYSIEVKL